MMKIDNNLFKRHSRSHESNNFALEMYNIYCIYYLIDKEFNLSFDK